MIYPLDYGYLEESTSGDEEGIDFQLGASGEISLSGIIICVVTKKRDAEIKLLLGLSPEEIKLATIA